MDVERASRTDVTLCIQVTPPKDRQQTMPQFLSVEAVTSVKRKASLEICSPLVKKSFVVPAILSRHETVHNYLSRNPSNQKIAVHLPGGAEPILSKIDALQKAQDTLQAETNVLRSEVQVLRAETKETNALRSEVQVLRAETKETNALRSEVQALRAETKETNALRSEVQALRAALDVDQRRRYTLFRANTLADFIQKANEKKCSGRKLSASGGQPGASFPTAQRLQRTAALITEKDLMGWGLDIKYKAFLQKTDEVMKARNTSAHETSEDFAILLSSPPFINSPHYHYWAPLFAFTYGTTIEELAKNSLQDDFESLGF